MTRFVRMFRYDPDKDPTARLRLDWEPKFGNAVLADEDTLPEEVDNPDARHVNTVFTAQLTTSCIRWLYVSTRELLREMEAADERHRNRRRGKGKP